MLRACIQKLCPRKSPTQKADLARHCQAAKTFPMTFSYDSTFVYMVEHLIIIIHKGLVTLWTVYKTVNKNNITRFFLVIYSSKILEILAKMGNSGFFMSQ